MAHKRPIGKPLDCIIGNGQRKPEAEPPRCDSASQNEMAERLEKSTPMTQLESTCHCSAESSKVCKRET
ncbi:hypothetical protein Tcan_16833 [Toxocara canis]|uniref:Uncharacterized protein n=1 Tax=Toxocara canis TaxID=6265 RepID=A0A0B2VFJ8_TOXCA|nr:hypothetical protein Tcan_16833 [Toxocara canis]